MNGLSTAEIKRYSRHILLSEIGMEGQKKLKNASVLVVGAGGLGSPLATYLAAAGVGKIGIVDFDVVDESNLQRQILFSTTEIGKQKALAARERLIALNPFLDVEIYPEKLTSKNAIDIIEKYDIVADATDNFPTRYLVNDVCMLLDKPNVYASIFGFEGQASVFSKGKGACYRCLFPNPPAAGSVPSCNEAGVLGVLPGVLGTVQATEVIKLILGIGDPLIGRLLSYNALEMSFDEVSLQQNPDCPVCGNNPTINAPIDYEEFCGVKEEMVNGTEIVKNISPVELERKIKSDEVFLLLDIREYYELNICTLPGATHIRMEEVPNRLNEIAVDKDVVVFCHLGIRSRNVVGFLLGKGNWRVLNLKGGIDLYAQECDHKMLRY